MTVEERVFKNKRFIFEKLKDCGFEKTDGVYKYKTCFLKGDFKAEISVSDAGEVSGRVIDNMSGEEYSQLRSSAFDGAYVNSVRDAYEKLLIDMSEKCCRNVLFASDQANRVTKRIFDIFGVKPDFPFNEKPHEKSGVFRHGDSGKWFALIMNIKWDRLLKNKNENTVDVINLKINPVEGDKLRDINGIYPAYHMNRKNWISVVLNDTLSDGEVSELIEKSFDLTKKQR
ncbi:MAG: MmcQ/YjbR family DNA-binding protein [Clostridia bacterium]|nr:MmcQ/YjbR family DNA-binding protein [Clostridia bacterium]